MRPALACFAFLVLFAGCGQADSSAAVRPSTTTWGLPASAVPHVFIIMMENEGNAQIVGNKSAPYLNWLIKHYGFAANYASVTHPSLPNYLATIAGTDFGARSDSESQRFTGRTIVDQLEAHGLTWKAYMESLPRPGYTGDVYPTTGPALYHRKHDPFMLMTRILNRPDRRKKVVPATQLYRDLAAGTVPALAYITPNMCNDMHGISEVGSPCPPNTSQLIHRGDHFLSRLIPRILHSRAWVRDSAIFVVWDEGYQDSNAPSPAIVIARGEARHYTSRASYNHYSLLKTLQVIWHLGCLAHTCNTGQVAPMVEFLRPRQ